ncbi:MAG: GDP-mannose 4,6-dehydratase [Candidatus Levybacteria bacterium]|nr:GDP-mannose 4,6-dehydratase [Candidatus Levybacteria bacterium]
MKKVLITGVTGFVGQYLSENLLSQKNLEIYGTYFSDEGLSRLENARLLHLKKVDLTVKKEVFDLLDAVKPDQIYHLAAQTSPSDSLKDPEKTLLTNTLSQLYLLESLRELGSKTRLLVTSSADVYGIVEKEDLPVDEQTQFRPINPYAVSKITQDFLALQYFLSYNIDVVRVRPFNHVGPRQASKFVVPMFAKQIAEIEKLGKEPIVKVGNLSAKKDFSDVRDIVRAYILLMEKGESGDVYNVGSGKSTQIQEILNILLSLSEREIKIEEDQDLFRPIDIPELVCDNSKLSNLTGWKPEISLETTLKDTLDYFRKVV